MTETVVSVRMTADLKKKIETVADAERRTTANMIRVLLEDALQARRGKS